MWIVQLALRRPYTFVVAALLLLIVSAVTIVRTPVDIFPNINIPVVSIVWQYNGMSPKDFEGNLTWPFERVLTTTVNDIEHIESQTVNGIAVVKVYFQPHAKLETALAQVTAISQTVLKGMPPGTTPPLVISYNASSVPILQLGLSSAKLSEQQLNDFAMNFVRVGLTTVPGAAMPWPYGGKVRQITVDIDLNQLTAHGLSPNDMAAAINVQNLILPGGTAKIGSLEYDVEMNGRPQVVDELNNLPVKTVNGTVVYMRDVAHVRDGFQVQTNIVRQDGQRGSLLSVYKTGGASTLDIVAQVKAALPRIAATLPPELRIQPLFDQSLFVRAAVQGVIKEAIIAACLTAMMILLFLGNWRHTLVIAISIPLSILSSIVILSALGETINIMTLGGLALAVGILVDDATVTIENIDRNLAEGKELYQGILDGAAQIAMPAFVSTLVHLHRVRADVFPRGRRALPFRAAGGVGGLCDAGLLCDLADARPHAGDVFREGQPREARPWRGGPGSVVLRAVPAGFRARVRAFPQRVLRLAGIVPSHALEVHRRFFPALHALAAAGRHDRPGFLPDRGCRAVPPPHAGAHGDAHRGDGAHLRPRGAIDPQTNPGRAN